ncbi:hypothetical protein RND81_05G139300 [Saponaria officinalis]|uniref:F-box associated beta-propeller type 3 domain-containing protein n=1 Tax=Saponaria officinalis TaxID=3572 RepID=A0AAW1KYE0_SAPOF
MKNYLTRTTSSSNVLDIVECIFDVAKSGEACLYSFTERKTLRLSKKFDCVPNIPVRMYNSCHGIICFHLRSRLELLLCNPSIQEVMLIPPCPNKGSERALGFDPVNQDYKIVAFSFNYHKVNTANVYSLREGRWRNLRVNSVNLQCCNTYWGVYFALNANGRICNWLGQKSPIEKTIILSFDMVEEVFKELPMPE